MDKLFSQRVSAVANVTGYSQVTPVTIANDNTEQTLVGAGVGTLIFPANYFTTGKAFKFKMNGFFSSTGSPTIMIRAKLSGSTIAQSIATSTNGAVDGFMVEGLITCIDDAAGTFACGGQYAELKPSGISQGITNSSPVTGVNVAAPLTFDITVTWGTADAGNTITSQLMVLEELN